RGPCARVGADRGEGRGGRKLRHRRQCGAQQSVRRRDDLRYSRRPAAARRRRFAPRSDHLRHRPAGPRPSLRDRCGQDLPRPRLDPPRNLPLRPRTHRRLVSRQWLVVAAAARRPLCRGTPWPAGGRAVRILVTGSSGQLATSLVERAAAMPGIQLTALGRPRLDVTDRTSVMAGIAASKPDVVISAAAYTAVDRAEDEPDRAYAINVTGAATVAEAAERAGAAVIHLSTDYVFAGTD